MTFSAGAFNSALDFQLHTFKQIVFPYLDLPQSKVINIPDLNTGTRTESGQVDEKSGHQNRIKMYTHKAVKSSETQ